MHIQYLLFRSKAFKQGDRLSDSQGFILMAFVNDVVGDDVREGVGEDKEHMLVDRVRLDNNQSSFNIYKI